MKNMYITQKLYNNNFNNISDNNYNNFSFPTNNTHKTRNDLLMEEFYNKENKIESLHNMANTILNNSLNDKNSSNNEQKNPNKHEDILNLESQYAINKN